MTCQKVFWACPHFCNVCAVCCNPQIIWTTRRGWLQPPVLKIMTFSSARTLYISSGSPACNLYDCQSCSGHSNKQLLVQSYCSNNQLLVPLYCTNKQLLVQLYHTSPAVLAIMSLPYSITTQKRFSKLQKEGLPIPSMGFRLAKVNSGLRSVLSMVVGFGHKKVVCCRQ